VPRRIHIDDGVAVYVIDHILVIFHRKGRTGCGGKELWVLGHLIHFCDPCDDPIGYPCDRVFQLNDRTGFSDFCNFAIGHTLSIGARVE
jgi:hypothetical protein